MFGAKNGRGMGIRGVLGGLRTPSLCFEKKTVRPYEGETPWYPPFARFLLLHFLVRRGDSVSASNPPIFNPLGAANRHE